MNKTKAMSWKRDVEEGDQGKWQEQTDDPVAEGVGGETRRGGGRKRQALCMNGELL